MGFPSAGHIYTKFELAEEWAHRLLVAVLTGSNKGGLNLHSVKGELNYCLSYSSCCTKFRPATC